jgi:hypothetical protein
LPGLGVVRVPADFSAQPLLTQLVICFAKDLKLAAQNGVGLLRPKLRRRANDIDKEGKKNETEDRDA